MESSPAFDRRKHPPGATFSRWPAPDGWDHRRMDWPQPRGAKLRGSLLFAGGRGDFIEKYLEAHAHWHGRGWNVTSFDWRGQGASRGSIVGGHLDQMDVLVEDLVALVEQWSANNPEPHVLVGHSMGGHVLMRALAERRVRLDAAVAVAPMLQVNSNPLPPIATWWVAGAMNAFGWGREPIWSRKEASGGRGSQRQAILTSCAERYQDELWWWEQEPRFDLGAPSWGWLSAAYRSCAALTDAKLGKIETPLLFVGTERDRLVSPDEIRRVAGVVPGAEIRMFPRAGHEILRETDKVRREALARIDAFLDAKAPK
jgi:lysophospholipase